MSHEEIAASLNEVPNKSTVGLMLGMAIKYGLPSICCVWLFFVIKCKDDQIFTMAKDTTAALVQNNSALEKLAKAIESKTRD
jgi:hypothetical protein